MLNSKMSLQLWKSLIYKRNKRGPNTEPCGTSYLIGVLSDLICPIETNWHLLLKYEENQS
jgi:hypothetical protein